MASEAGVDHVVETRTSKSGVIGLVGPVAAAFAVAASATPGAHVLPGPGSGSVTGAASMGDVPIGAGELGSVVVGHETLCHQTVGSLPAEVSMGRVSADAGHHTRVDVDADGHWDPYVAYERTDGGVDILADAVGDGRVDFVGHDDDRDGLVDDAVVDRDRDGLFETRMYDDTGDGWLDRSERS